MKTITCLICERQHALFYTKHSDSSMTLNYICDRIPVEKITDTTDCDGKPVFETRYHTRTQEIPSQPGLDIPTHWSNRYSQQQNDKQQSTLKL